MAEPTTNRKEKISMLELDRLQDDIAALPKDAQQMIVDFVHFLKQRHQVGPDEPSRPLSFDDQPFVGMWSDRLDMQDSARWVRQTRQQQWQR